MKLSLVLLLGFFVLLGCTRSDNLRIRALAPMQEQSSADNLVSAEKSGGAITSSGIRTTGRSYSVVFSGLSVGFTEISTDRSIRSKAGNDVVLDEFFTTNAKYNELGVMFGDELTLTLGVGGLVSGSAEIKLDYGSSLNAAVNEEIIRSTSPSGNSAFFTFGYDLQPFEILAGWRWNNFKASLRSSNTNLETLANAGKLSHSQKSFSRQTTQVTAGLGISF
jgi:hypothetical protein